MKRKVYENSMIEQMKEWMDGWLNEKERRGEGVRMIRFVVEKVGIVLNFMIKR